MALTFEQRTSWPVPCGRRRGRRGAVACEKPALHDQGCLGMGRAIHQGRDKVGRWHSWPRTQPPRSKLPTVNRHARKGETACSGSHGGCRNIAAWLIMSDIYPGRNRLACYLHLESRKATMIKNGIARTPQVVPFEDP